MSLDPGFNAQGWSSPHGVAIGANHAAPSRTVPHDAILQPVQFELESTRHRCSVGDPDINVLEGCGNITEDIMCNQTMALMAMQQLQLNRDNDTAQNVKGLRSASFDPPSSLWCDVTSLRPPGAQDMLHRGEGKAVLVISQFSHNLSVSL